MGAQRGLTVYVVDRHVDGPKPALVRDLGGIHHASLAALDEIRPDIVMDAPAPARSSAMCSAAGAGPGRPGLLKRLITRRAPARRYHGHHRLYVIVL
jgi:hypothetical protein